jgi:hypothetical protein
MATFLRSGIAGSANGNASPVTPPLSQGNGSGGSSGGKGSATATPGRGHSGFNYHPHSVTQAITYNVGRALGKATGSKNADNK